MSKIRTIDTHFWDDGYIQTLSPEDKLLFIYLFTNPLMNICGIYELSIRKASFDTGVSEERVLKALKGFEASEKIFYIDGWIVLKNFLKHQSVNPNIIKGIDRCLDEIPANLWEKVTKITPLLESLSKASEAFGLLKLKLKLKPIGKKIYKRKISETYPPDNSQSPPDQLKEKNKKFIPPTIEEIKTYCEKIQHVIDCERFLNFYESKGWMVGKNKMKDWKAAVRNWKNEQVKSNNKNFERICDDGTKAIMRGGVWVDANNPMTKIDLSYYPELTK